MEFNIKTSHQMTIRAWFRSNRLAILLEIILVLAPTYACLLLGYRPENDFISLGGDLVLLGRPLIWLAMGAGLLLIRLTSKVSGASWHTVGLNRLTSFVCTALSGIALTVATILAIVTLQVFLPPAFSETNTPDTSFFAALQGNPANLLLNVFVIWITAGFVDELIWRGYLMNRLADFFGKTRASWAVSLVCSAVIFGVAHYYQGPSGMMITGLIGLLFGSAYLVLHRNLWPLIIAHSLINTISFVDIFLNGT
jgi:membrane protease YdiL (CAAX protease family)